MEKSDLTVFSKQQNSNKHPRKKLNTYLSIAYLPPIAYFVAMQKGDNVVVEQHENYIKQTYRNRCNILTNSGRMTLSIPTQKNNTPKTAIKEVKIAPHDNWQRHHWRTLKNAYRSSPFFEYYEDDFAPFYHQQYNYLWDYNLALLNLLTELLGIDKKITLTQTYSTTYHTDIDMREKIHPKKKTVMIPQQYYQLYGEKNNFESDLSIIDLLFNMGNESILILNKTKLLT